MARTDSLGNFLTDLASSIKEKTGKIDEPLKPVNFDTEILAIETGADFEINKGAYLFYGGRRGELAEILLPLCINMVDILNMFNGATSVIIPIELGEGAISDTLSNTSSYSGLFTSCKAPSIKIVSKSTTPTTTATMFKDCSEATDIDVTGLVTTNVTTMDNMFNGCSSIENLDLSNLNTAKVTTMQYFLANCSSLKQLPTGFTTLDVGKVKTPTYLLQNCSSLENIDLSSMSFPVATTFDYMFYNCSSAKDIKLPTAGSSMKSLNYTFYGCDSLETFDLNGLNTGIITGISYLFGSGSTDNTIEGKLDLDMSDWTMYTSLSFNSMFRGNKCCRSIILPDLSNVTLNGATALQYMFYQATSVETITIPTIKDASKVTTFANMFNGCKRLKTINGFNNIISAGAKAGKPTTINQGLYRMFYGCEALESVDLTGLDTSLMTQGDYSNWQSTNGIIDMFNGCKSLKTLDISHFVLGSGINNLSGLITNCEALESIALPDFSTTSITSAANLFNGCKSLKSLDNVTGYPIPWTKFTNFANMFANSGLETFTFDQNIINNRGSMYLNNMFSGCENLREVDASALGYLVNDRYSTVKEIFANCPNLETVDISGFWYNGGYGTGSGLEGMFMNCTSLKNVTLHHVASEPFVGTHGYPTGITSMFENCTSLEVLDLRNFFPSSGTQMGYGKNFLKNCRKLRKLDLRDNPVYGTLGPGSSTWSSTSNVDVLTNVGVDNDTPTIVYVNTTGQRSNIISLAAKCGLSWSTENVIVASSDEQVDMS